jgi:hypothetical protein
MIFARYNGTRDDLTNGRVYLAKPTIDDGTTVGLDVLSIDSDPGPVVEIHPGNDNFEYLEEVYAVLVRPMEDWGPGEVVVITDAVEDSKSNLFEPQGHLVRVKGMGLYRASNFVLLDRTNIFPGLVVMDASTGRWVTVRRVDECLWFMANGSKIYRSPEEFKFSVSGGDILTEPLVKCVDASGELHLTEGNLYRLRESHEDTVTLVDDNKQTREFKDSRFHSEG